MMRSNLLKTMLRINRSAPTSARATAPIAAAASATTTTNSSATTTTTTTTTTTSVRCFAKVAGKTTAKATTTTTTSTTGGAQLSALTAENPYRDVLHYQHKNRTWSLQHVEYYTTALAIGFLEQGIQPGDIVLSWLPDHFSEQMVLQFACSKAGLVLYTLDPAQATTDPAKAEQALAAALEITKANILVSQEAGSDVNYVQLAHNVIPELRIFDTALGMPFVTPRFPHLRLAVQTGFDQDDKAGWFPLRHMLVPSGNLDSFLGSAVPKAETPLAGELVMKDGLPVGTKVYTNQQVIDQNVWPTFNAVLKTDFQEVEGVGVIF